MALTDLDALNIYRDPTLSPKEKIAAITGRPMQPIPSLPPALAALPAEATAQVPPEAARAMGAEAFRAPVEGAGHTRSIPDVSKLPSGTPAPVAEQQKIISEREQLTQDLNRNKIDVPTFQAREAQLKQRQAELDRSIVKPGEPSAATQLAAHMEGEEPAAAGGEDPGAFRNAIRRFAISDTPGGAAPKPSEKVRIEEQLQGGGMGDEDFDELGALATLRDWHTMQGAVLQTGLERDAGNIQLGAQQRIADERAALAEIQRRTMEKTAAINARRNEISEQIAATDPKEPSLWAGKNFGDKLLTALSLMMFTVGAGASKDPKLAIESIKAMANKEADRQARWLAARKGAADELGTIYDRHVAAYGDAELAHRATVIDIMGKAEMQLGQMINDPRTTQMQSHNLMAQQAGLAAARKQAEGALRSDMGNKFSRATAIEFMQERQARPPAPAAAPAAPAPAPVEAQAAPAKPPMSPGDQRALDALAQVEAQTEAFRTTPQGQAPAVQKPAAAKPAPALAGRPALQKAPAAASGPTTPAQTGKGDWMADVDKRWRAGDYDGALAALPDTARKVLLKKAKQLQKNAPDNLSFEEAVAVAMPTLLGLPIPKGFIPQSARDRAVTLSSGETLFAKSPEDAKSARAKLDSSDELIGLYRQLLRYAEMPSGNITPALKSSIDAYSTIIMPKFAVAAGQGALSEGEKELYGAISGRPLSEYFTDPRFDAKAAVRAALNANIAGRRLITGRLSSDIFGDQPYRAVREVK